MEFRVRPNEERTLQTACFGSFLAILWPATRLHYTTVQYRYFGSVRWLRKSSVDHLGTFAGDCISFGRHRCPSLR
jgi:hypothetical protein